MEAISNRFSVRALSDMETDEEMNDGDDHGFTLAMDHLLIINKPLKLHNEFSWIRIEFFILIYGFSLWNKNARPDGIEIALGNRVNGDECNKWCLTHRVDTMFIIFVLYPIPNI